MSGTKRSPIKQLGARSVLGWVTASPRPAYRNAEREVIFSETVDWGQTLLNGRLYRHRFSAIFLCPGANAIQHRRKWPPSHFQGRDLWREESERKEKGGWGYVKGNSPTGGNTNKKGCESRFPYCFLTDFTKLFFWGSTLLNFCFFTEESLWIHRIFKIRWHGKKNKTKIFKKFSIKYHSVLVHLRIKFQLDKSKFSWVRQFWNDSKKIQNLKKFERFNRFWPNLIPKFLDGCNIFECSFRTIARILRILRKLELPRPFFKKF